MINLKVIKIFLHFHVFGDLFFRTLKLLTIQEYPKLYNISTFMSIFNDIIEGVIQIIDKYIKFIHLYWILPLNNIYYLNILYCV